MSNLIRYVLKIFNQRYPLYFFIGVFYFCLIVCFSAQAVDNKQYKNKLFSIVDTNSYGNIDIYKFDSWVFSYDSPKQIKDTLNLNSFVTIPSLRDISKIKKTDRWKNFGWFELELDVDSALSGLPFILHYQGVEAVRIWINGKVVLKAGNPSIDPEQEVLARFINPIRVGFSLRKGKNYILIKYSSHGVGPLHETRSMFENGFYLSIVKPFEISQRRERSFIFGGTILLLINLVLIHLFLAFRFKGSYHIYVAFLTFFMLLHAFSTLSDTLIDWTADYIYFFAYTYALAYIFVLYFFLISIRKYFDLQVHWSLKNWILGISCFIAILIVKWDYNLLGYFHQLIMVLVFTYGSFTLLKVWKKGKNRSILIIAMGLFLTVMGTFLYVGVYLFLNQQINWLFYLSTLLSYTSIPISLTLIVASSYAKLISTLESQVKERTAKLEAANEFQKRFFANVSHEFRTPLTISEGLVSRILENDEKKSENTRFDLWLAKRNMVRLHNMVDQIIELTKADHHELVLNRTNIEADELVTLCVESFRSLAEYHGHSFDYYPTPEQVILFVDQSNTEIMINNLISNAIKFTPDGGSIKIKTWVTQGFFHLTVSDTGFGIAEENHGDIFVRFHRISQPDEMYVEGMGVGLELSRTLARLHGGDIIFTSTLGKGSTFQLTIPVSDQFDKAVVSIKDGYDGVVVYQEEEEPTQIAESNMYKILLVEDNADLIHYISSILNPLGTIFKARNGKEALALMEQFSPDIIITDLMMPIMGGIQLIEHLTEHSEWKDIPVIVLTARALEEEKTNVLRIGVVDYITKPFAPEQLVLKTKNLLRYYQTKQTLKISVHDEELIKTDSLSEKTAQFIVENIKATNISVDSLAATFAMSRSSFYRNLELEVGMAPAEFIREVRLTTARSIATKNPTMRLEELANTVGYKSASSFRKMYKDRFGEHPFKTEKA